MHFYLRPKNLFVIPRCSLQCSTLPVNKQEAREIRSSEIRFCILGWVVPDLPKALCSCKSCIAMILFLTSTLLKMKAIKILQNIKDYPTNNTASYPQETWIFRNSAMRTSNLTSIKPVHCYTICWEKQQL